MNLIKKLAGIVWIILGLAAIAGMVLRAGTEITEAQQGLRPLLDTQMFWYIIIPVFSPIMLGLCLFGWYALKDEYVPVD